MNLKVDPENNIAPSADLALDAAAIGPSFAEQVRGQNAKPIDLTLARIMADLYDNGSGVDGWSPLDADLLQQAGIDPATLRNEDTGFLARIYGDSSGRYVIAYSGSDEGKDWLTNLRQGVGIDDAQYNQAIALAQEARVAFGDRVVITGHSLGGGLAGAASLVSGIPAVTFNASGVHDNTIERFGLDAHRAKAEAANSLIRRYAVDNEILTELQEKSIPLKWAMPDAVGHKIELADPDPLTFWQRLIPGNGIRHGIDLHYIDAVIKAQEQALQRQQASQPPTNAVPALDVNVAAPVSLSNDSHPEHRLYRQSYDGLQRLDAVALRFDDDQSYRNAAGSLALHARAGGLKQIDHVVLSADGASLFAVQGALNDPSHTRVQVDKARAAAEPLERSTAQMQWLNQDQPQTPQEREQRRMLPA